jgi:hypothetical protein
MLTLFGLLGIGGLGTAAFFIPGISTIAVSIAGGILRCKPCLVAIAIVAALIFGDVHGHLKSDEKCRAADNAMQLKAAQRDAAIAASTAALAQQQADDLSKANEKLTEQVNSYEKTIASRAGPGCPLAPADLRGLRNIGQP